MEAEPVQHGVIGGGPGGVGSGHGGQGLPGDHPLPGRAGGRRRAERAGFGPAEQVVVLAPVGLEHPGAGSVTAVQQPDHHPAVRQRRQRGRVAGRDVVGARAPGVPAGQAVGHRPVQVHTGGSGPRRPERLRWPGQHRLLHGPGIGHRDDGHGVNLLDGGTGRHHERLDVDRHQQARVPGQGGVPGADLGHRQVRAGQRSEPRRRHRLGDEGGVDGGHQGTSFQIRMVSMPMVGRNTCA